MNKKRYIFFIILFSFLLDIAQAAGVRGRLDGIGPYGAYPVTGVPVTVSNQFGGRSSPSYSDNQGMFYIYGLQHGQHTLEIWLGGPQPMILNIMVFGNLALTDIAPISVR